MAESVVCNSVVSKSAVLGSVGKYVFIIKILLLFAFNVMACTLQWLGETSNTFPVISLATAINIPFVGLPSNEFLIAFLCVQKTLFDFISLTFK